VKKSETMRQGKGIDFVQARPIDLRYADWEKVYASEVDRTAHYNSGRNGTKWVPAALTESASETGRK
jgi:hypothetical protein